MTAWTCGHEGEEGHSRLCPHLVGASEEVYARVLRGQGVEFDLCCPDCTMLIKSGESVEWVRVCEGCIELYDENEYNLIEWIGQPETKERLVAFNTTLLETTLAVDAAWAVTIAPLDVKHWVGFWQKGLFLVEDTGVTPLIAAPPYPEEKGKWHDLVLSPHIILSPDGRFAALCHDYGQYGFVVDLQEKRVTITLDKGEAYRIEGAAFPAAFCFYENRNLLVHVIEANQFAISDPVDGTLISASGNLGIYSRGIHSQLLASPDSHWLASDQGFEGGSGTVATWNLKQWLQSNKERSAIEAIRQMLCHRNYLWNIPIAWVDEYHVVVWGIGPDADLVLSGALVFDARSGKQTNAFAGPGKTAFFGAEGRLFSVEYDGLHVWDATTGDRMGHIPGFKPRWQRGDFLIELNASRLSGSRVKTWNWRTAFN